MMFEGKHIHYSPVDQKPLCSYSTKLCKQRRINGYAFCIRHILEDKSAPFKQCAHVARYKKQKCTNPIPSNENREFCNSHMQVAGMLPKKERKNKKDKDKDLYIPCDGKIKFADRLRALWKKENNVSSSDDPFDSEDPYAFPDPISESKNGCVSFSATPILRTAWNCSQKLYTDSVSSDSPGKGEQLPKTIIPTSTSSSITADKLKSHAPKLSKTMNRLHAKIAQNKLLDKQKKTQDSSQNPVGLASPNLHILANIKTEPLSPPESSNMSSESNDQRSIPDLIKSEITRVKVEPIEETSRLEDCVLTNSVTLPSSPSIVKQQMDSYPSPRLNNSCTSFEKSFNIEKSPSSSEVSFSRERPLYDNVKVEVKQEPLSPKLCKLPSSLRKVHRIFKSKKKKKKDILPLGFETSESEDSDSEGENHFFNQFSGFATWDSRSSSLRNMNSESRPERQAVLKRELQRSYQNLCMLNILHKQEAAFREELIHPLIAAARNCPSEVTQLLLRTAPKQKRISKSVNLEKTTCCYQSDDKICYRRALPFARHCQKHIMYNVDQLLFKHCTAKFADNTQCCVPVFDISHELPLCPEHAKKRDNYHKMASEPKPKKPRKKPKPSALTRPPKRGKKKKKQNLLRPTSMSPPPPLPALPPPPAPPPPPPPPAPQIQQQQQPLAPPPPPPVPQNSPPTVAQIEMSNNIPFNSEPVKTTSEGLLAVEDITKDIKRELDSELGSDLEDQFSPGAIEKTLELPLDTAELANQASKLLEEHDFTEVLNKIPDDAFNDLFVETRNGEYVPSREETEELERALAAVSKDVHLAKESLAKLSATDPDLEELERTIEIHGGLLGADNLTSAIDENTFNELTSSHIDSLNVITSSFSTSDLNSLSQALSGIATENLEQNNLPAVSDSTLIPTTPVVTVPLLTTDLSHPHVLNGHSGAVAGLHPLNTDPAFTPQLLESAAAALNAIAPPGTSQATSDSRLLGNSSVLSTLLFGLGQTTAAAIPQTTFSNCPTSLAGMNSSSEDAGLVSSPGGLTSTHWLLNSSDQVLTLSHMAYQNGFLVTSQGGTSYAGTPLAVAKHPLQALNAEVSLVSSNPPLVTSTTCSDNVLCGSTEQPLHSLNLPAHPSVSLQPTSSAAVIAQEGAS